MNRVTFFRNIKSPNEPHHATLADALSRIRDGKSRYQIEEYRASGDKKLKNSLPLVCFSGEFSRRADNDLINHSGLIVLDFDHVDVEESKAFIGSDEYVRACWVSPSGDGIKAIVSITNPERHRDHFRALRTYFLKQYNLEVDESGINESRACYESYDPDIVVNNNSKKFGHFASERSESQAVQVEDHYTDYYRLNLAARMIRTAEDGGKHAALLSASRLVGGFITAGKIEEEEATRILLREIEKRDVDDLVQAKRTIHEGIEQGKKDPIKDTVDAEQDARRELLINDGDMSFVSSDDEDFRWIDDYSQGKIQVGLDTGDETFDKYFRYKKEFLIMNGHSNVGKTTNALYLMVNAAIRHAWKWVVYSSENKTASIKMKLMEMACNKKSSMMTYSERKIAYEWVKKHFTVISNRETYSFTDILIFCEKVLRQQEADAIFIDPYNSLKVQSGKVSEHQYHYEAASEFLTFANKHDVAVWLNMHAVTEAQRRKGEDGLPIAPFAEDTEGGGKFVNRADSFVTIHRKVQAPDNNQKRTAEFHVRKVRETETGGEPTPWEEPIKFILNTQGTGFRITTTMTELFQPIQVQAQQQELESVPSAMQPNLNFTGE
jgi:replicative DNA helicase